ncbi:DUF3376 domain-containing protein [Agromyces intestinalis]|uniref:DUF3376 domain-containing protein n=1 Tax=Agromyces intestinalis TaxID=2592652 RepID=A0A5C1YJD5_9MICO|nr:DUF3376 domain-containing protein [Agromyces intestinalis]QEO15249.1 DUF3376 domain-containing protein [Agromyces intestinalis]
MVAAATPRRERRRVRVVFLPPGRSIAQECAAIRVRTGHEPLPSATRTLRIALAMRGGVSLAVWIGGVAAEVDLLRRIRLVDVGDETWAIVPCSRGAEPSPAVERRVAEYAALLDLAGYDRVEVDLLAGASAGGLNAVVYAVAQRAGMSLDGLLRTWSTVGGFWGLLNEPGERGILAIMRGEGYFRRRVRTALGDLYLARGGHDDLVAEHVSVELSTTVIDAQDEYEEDASDGRGHFHFVGSDRHHLDNLIPRREAPHYPGKLADDLEQLWHLALAARSTSSLAGGFEPAHIPSTEWPGLGDADEPGDPAAADPQPPEPETVAERADLRFAFAVHRARRGEPYRVIDGAVFDNVPIDRALRAAKLLPSGRLADRTLLFLDPEPDPPLGGPAPWDPAASRYFRAIGAMLSRSFRRESVAREAAELGRFNGQRLVDDGRRLSGAALASGAATTPEAARERRRAYVRSLGSQVAEQLGDALAQPSIWQLHSSGRRRRAYPPVDRQSLGVLQRRATAHWAELAADDVLRDATLAGPVALGDAANCVLAWARALETVPDAPGSRRGLVLASARRTGYAALADATGSRDALVEQVLLDRLRRLGPRDAPTDDDADRWLSGWTASERDIRTASHWRALDAAIDELARRSADVEREASDRGETPPEPWASSPWRAVHAVAGRLPAVDLAPLMNAGGVPPSLSQVTYWAIGVDEEPANPRAYTALLDDKFHTRLQTLLRTPRLEPARIAADLSTPEAVPLDRQTKLAGYGVGNFLGFLAAEWRVNDWWWGRLDGAAGLVRYLGRELPADEVADRVREVQSAVLEQADEPRYGEQSPFDGAVGGDAERSDATATPGLAGDAGDADASPAETSEGAGDDREPRTSARAAAPSKPDPASAPLSGAVAPDEPDDADRLRARMRAGTDTLWNLAPSYRFALASRALRLLDRAARPANRVVLVIVQVVLAVLRPVLVVLPTAADPPRLAAVAGIVAAAAWLLTWTTFAPSALAIGVAWSALGIVVAALAVGVARGFLRWSAVARALPDGDLRRQVSDARRHAIAPTVRYGLVALASLAPLWIAVARMNLVMAALCLGVSLALVALSVRSSTAARRTTVRSRRVRISGLLAVFAVLGGVLPVLQLAAAQRPAGVPDWVERALQPPLEWDLPILTVCAILAAFTLSVGWLPVRFDRAARQRSNGIDWMSLPLVASAYALGAGLLVELALAGLEPLPRTSFAVVAFILVWGNLVWWLPEARRRELPRGDGLVRAPLRSRR